MTASSEVERPAQGAGHLRDPQALVGKPGYLLLETKLFTLQGDNLESVNARPFLHALNGSRQALVFHTKRFDMGSN